MPDSVQAPVPDLLNEVRLTPPLSTKTPASSPVPTLDPCKLSVLLPTPVAVTALVNFSSPLPDWTSVPPPVVPARSSTRSVVSPLPVYSSVPVVAPPPRPMVPLPAVVGAPRLLLVLPPVTLLSVPTLRLPFWMMVLPV